MTSSSAILKVVCLEDTTSRVYVEIA
jgi:hypothetical protein